MKIGILAKISKWLAALAVVLSASNVVSFAVDCPPCNRDVDVMPGHGPASSTDPRRVIWVVIDDSWGNKTNNAIWNGVNGCSGCPTNGGLSRWNAHPSFYYFQNKQTYSGSEKPDIIIKQAKPGEINPGNCTAAVTVKGQPGGVILLPPEAANWTQDRIACAIAHEVGHVIGLADTWKLDDGTTCASIMNDAKNKCKECFDYNVRNNDVATANKQANDSTRPDCLLSLYPTSSGGSGGGSGSSQRNCEVHWYQYCGQYGDGGDDNHCYYYTWWYTVICQ